MLRPHLTVPGAGQGAESRLGCHGPSPSLPLWSPAPYPLTEIRASHRTSGQLPAFASGSGPGGQDPPAACRAGSWRGSPAQP